jgi:glycosyltransferase involved in cell wall biosynthesis
MPKICIVIPCFNEENRLSKWDFINYPSDKMIDVSFCFVNDGSHDHTIRVLNELKSHVGSRIIVLDNKENKGKAAAIRDGVLHARETGKFDLFGYFDADLATPLFEIKRFVLEFQSNPQIKMVLGSRVKRLGASITRLTTRHILGRIFATIASLMLQLDVYDSQCGSKLFSSDIIDDIFGSAFHTKWLFDIEIIARLMNKYPDAKNMMTELPLKQWKDIGGSKLRLKHILKVPFDLIKIQKKYLKKYLAK